MAQKAKNPVQATAPKKAAPTPTAKKATAPTPNPVMLQTYVMGPWPAKARTGGSIRQFCYLTAVALQQANPKGFTLPQYAQALCNGLPAWHAQGGTCPNGSATGFGTPATPAIGNTPAVAAVPNGNANTHAKHFAKPTVGWLSPVGAS